MRHEQRGVPRGRAWTRGATAPLREPPWWRRRAELRVAASRIGHRSDQAARSRRCYGQPWVPASGPRMPSETLFSPPADVGGVGVDVHRGLPDAGVGRDELQGDEADLVRLELGDHRRLAPVGIGGEDPGRQELEGRVAPGDERPVRGGQGDRIDHKVLHAVVGDLQRLAPQSALAERVHDRIAIGDDRRLLRERGAAGPGVAATTEVSCAEQHPSRQKNALDHEKKSTGPNEPLPATSRGSRGAAGMALWV